MAEQISVLAKDKVVSGEELMNFIPDSTLTSLPVKHSDSNGSGSDFTERELLYKMLFEMKKDINDLKKFMLEVYQKDIPVTDHFTEPVHHDPEPGTDLPMVGTEEKTPIIIDNLKDYSTTETVDESLSIADKEKELIMKALKKHRGKRKHAAADLGISERTLYRKIKEYDINE